MITECQRGDAPIEHRMRNHAEAAIARRFPVAFACWDSLEAQAASPARLAAQLGVAPERVRLLAEVAEYLIVSLERAMWARYGTQARGP